jgi:hypothetical protein
MAQTGYTPISIFSSATASAVPLAANLVQGELAINTNDGKLFYKDSSGVVQTMASKATGSIGGSTTQVQFNNSGVLGGSASLTWNGTVLTSSGFSGPLNGTVGATTPAAGSFTTTTIGTSETLSYGTANGVTYLNGSKVLTSGSALTFDGTNLGVGTSSPSQKLEVAGNAKLTGTNLSIVPSTATSAAYTLNTNTGGNFFLGIDSSTGAAFTGTAYGRFLYSGGAYPIVFLTNDTERMRLDSSGNVGIGTSSPATKLNVSSTGNGNRALFDDTTNDNTLGIYSDSTDIRLLSLNNARGSYKRLGFQSNVIVFSASNGSESARIDSSGNLLVGTTSQILNGNLSVLAKASSNAAAFESATSTVYPILSLFGNEGSGNQIFTRFSTDSNVERGSITYNRGAGIVAYNVTSDYRAKDISGPVTDSGALIDATPVYMGKMKGATQERPMFIAHEVPAYAHTGEKDAVDADGNPVYQQMDASALIPVMWAEIQSLRIRLAALEAK